MVPMPRRMFIGLIPDRATQFAIQRHCRRWRWPEDCRPTRFGRYHLTLDFLGYVGPGIESRLRRALHALSLPPLEIELALTQLWGGIAVLRPSDEEAVRALHDAVAKCAAAAGLPGPRNFNAHVTLARDAAGAEPPAGCEPIAWRVRDFVLVWSRVYPEVAPSRYEIVDRFALDASGSWPGGQAGRSQLALF